MKCNINTPFYRLPYNKYYYFCQRKTAKCYRTKRYENKLQKTYKEEIAKKRHIKKELKNYINFKLRGL